MNKNFIDVEYEIRKYFLIYLLIAYGIFLAFNIFKDVNLFDYYMKTVDSHFYKLESDLAVEYNNLIKNNGAVKSEVYKLTEQYYEIKDYISVNQHILKYYFPGIVLIGLILLSYIHVAIKEIYIKKKFKKVLKAVKLSKVYPIISLILMITIALIDIEGNSFIIKSIENVNIIISFILISFGIFVAISLIGTITSKTRHILTVINIFCILLFPKIFWFLGVWGSLFNVKIIKKVNGNAE